MIWALKFGDVYLTFINKTYRQQPTYFNCQGYTHWNYIQQDRWYDSLFVLNWKRRFYTWYILTTMCMYENWSPDLDFYSFSKISTGVFFWMILLTKNVKKKFHTNQVFFDQEPLQLKKTEFCDISKIGENHKCIYFSI
mgnify:CR=1 FL=1